MSSVTQAPLCSVTTATVYVRVFVSTVTPYAYCAHACMRHRGPRAAGTAADTQAGPSVMLWFADVSKVTLQQRQ